MDENEVETIDRKVSWLGQLGWVFTFVVIAGLLFPWGMSAPSPDEKRRHRARNELGQICISLKAHVVEYGYLPSGSNAEIMAVLRGGNPRGVVFLEAQIFNALGEFTDPWGTPYHIDTSNSEYPWGYSFGKDTKDDGGALESDDIPSWR